MATKYGRSNARSFHRVLACSAWGPGFDSPLRRNILRWLWSSLYIVVTPTWCAILTQQHAFGRISMRTLHATESHSATIPHRDLGGAVAAQGRSRMVIKYGRSNGSFHRVLACSSIPGWYATFSDALCKGCTYMALVKSLHFFKARNTLKFMIEKLWYLLLCIIAAKIFFLFF